MAPRWTWFSFMVSYDRKRETHYSNVIKARILALCEKEVLDGPNGFCLTRSLENCLLYSFVGIKFQIDFLFLGEVGTFSAILVGSSECLVLMGL